MNNENENIVAEALRLLTALEGSVKEVAASLDAKMKPEVAAVKVDILASLWRDGNAALMRVESVTGPHPRRGPFTEAYAAAMAAATKRREGAVSKPSILDTTMAGQPSRADHLPRIELPKFEGSPSEWPAFSSRFEKRVAGLTEDSDKFAFLIKCLERCDIARHSCEAFENAGMPFAQAWAKLEERFYKKRVAFMGHIRKILELPRMSSPSANALMRVIDVVETAVASARQIAEAGDSTSVVEDGLIVALVMDKLDAETIASVTRRADQQLIPTWVELRRELDGLANKIYYQPKRKEDADRARGANQRAARTVLAATVTPKPAAIASRPARKAPATQPAAAAIVPASTSTKGGNAPPSGSNSSNDPAADSCQSSRALVDISPTEDIPLLDNYVLLATVAILIQDNMGMWQRIRCVLDSGSQIEAITKNAVKRLGLAMHPARLTLSGVGSKIPVTQQIRAKITSIDGSCSEDVGFFVIPGLSDQPARAIRQDELDLPEAKFLADAEFYHPGTIDAILGARICFDALKTGLRRLPNGLTLQNSKFGWLVGGMLRDTTSADLYEHSCLATCVDDLKEILERFWRIEELPNDAADSTVWKSHELETHFKEHTTIADDGRYIVQIPLRGELNQLGDSMGQARRRLLALERRLASHEPTYAEYRKFMREYQELGHMCPVSTEELPKVRYVIPHSCVVKPDSTTTKLRVVFDASAKSTTGISLNDLQAVGPVIQPDLFRIWLDFRTQTVVATADIVKMYRQVWVSEPDTWMQCILWRDKPKDTMQLFRLLTVTYGEAASSYLACRALFEAGEEVRTSDPQTADAIQSSFYVDNLSLGASTPEQLRELMTSVERALNIRGMPLRKWASNSPEITSKIPVEHRDTTVQIGEKQAIKLLGLAWCPTEDTFQLVVQDEFYEPLGSLEKRRLASKVGKLYDPIGILQPVIVTGKILLQDLWRDGFGWDEAASPRMIESWNGFASHLPLLRQLPIPRMALPSEPQGAIMYGFSDASTKAFGCAIYLRFLDGEGNPQSRLLCSRSRLAPIEEVTLPRLELQGALLLARLYAKIKDAFGTRISQTRWWTDSQVVLAWIRSDNTKWGVYVKNRVEKIHAATNRLDWSYVPTKLNPADLVSRGLPANKLINSETASFWLNGPSFIVNDERPVMPQLNYVTALEEAVDAPLLLTAMVGNDCDDLLSQYKHHNSFIMTRRHFAWLGRAIFNLRAPSSSVEKKSGPLQLDELEYGLQLIVRVMQATCFPNEVKEMQDSGSVTPKGSMQHLDPIVRDKIICVRGRLGNSDLADEAKVPFLVPKSHPFSRVIIRHLHEHNFHAGTELIMAEFRARFWMRDLRRTVVGVTSRCVICARARPRQYAQQMGQLPSARVNVSPAFTHTGVDLCGPFEIVSNARSGKRRTVYVCIFVCFTTKATHLEVVEDQSTSAFISALLRFVSLRGRPDTIYSDNGRNFVGAARELTLLRKTHNNREFQDEVVSLAADSGIRFSFIPPRSPNFGGLWEANIKVAKRLFKAAAKGAQLNLVELQTLLYQISAILNSRPLTAIHSSPESVEALTPAHFLIGRASFTTPAPLGDDDTVGVKTRWKRVQKLAQQFWSRWRTEYLAQLRCSAKWTKRTTNLQTGQIVLVGDDNLPVGRWPMGLVVKTYVGPDGIVRVADIRTSSGIYKRNVRLLAPLPVEAAETEVSKEHSGAPDSSVSDAAPNEQLEGSAAQCPPDSTPGYVPPTTPEHEDDPPPTCGIWDGRLRPKGGRNGCGK
ncbi:uncharacterized protein LOC131293780 [Anopheles ziemanni]|uniref:uncharacterized protein LOC131264561 n=2 Tax=Anopheles coustani TaxID=139045 RepID=UPI002659C3AB|nr:uncharacterized protein LOC131264561 [Anopheles coustani]XP_058177820.1 uncharacterized protein LOC131293780 [Anopheles ziemanni]